MGKYFVAIALVLFGIGSCVNIPILVGLFIGLGVALLWLGVYDLNIDKSKEIEK